MLQQMRALFGGMTRFQVAAVVGLLLLGVLLRVQQIDRPMLYDETYTYEVYVHPGIAHALARYDFPNNHILHSLMVYVVTRVSHDEIAIRVPALLFSLGSLLLIFLMAKKFIGVPAAIYTLMFFVLARYQIEYAHNARGYALNVFFTLVSAYGLFSVIQSPHSSGVKRFWWLFVGGAVASMYALPTTVFYLCSTAAFCLLYGVTQKSARAPFLRDSIRYHLIVAGISLALYIPPMVFFYVYPDKMWFLGAEQHPNLVLLLPGIWAYLCAPFSNGSSEFHLAILVMVGAGIFVLARADRSRAVLLACILVVPFLVMVITRVTAFDRNLLYLQPFMFMALAAGLARIQTAWQHTAWRLLTGSVIVVMVAATSAQTTVNDFFAPYDRAPQQAAALLNTLVQPDDILLTDVGIDNLMRYYLTPANKEKYVAMFAHKRTGRLVQMIQRSSPVIYCVFDGPPDFDRLARIYRLSMEYLRQHYLPFVLYRSVGKVTIYRATKA